MEKLQLMEVQNANREGIRLVVARGLVRLEKAQSDYLRPVLGAISNGDLSRQIDRTYAEIQQNPRALPNSRLAQAAGAYFLNEDIIGGSREAEVLEYTNALADKYEMPPQSQKIKLGPGIGFVEAPPLYRRLKLLGLSDPDLTINYTAPFGTAETRKGIKTIADAKINPEGDFFPTDGVFLTRGATEAIDLFMSALAATKPNSRVVFLGLSYYTGPFSCIQKGLIPDRLVSTDPTRTAYDNRYFPPSEQIERKIPVDTSAIVLTMPNNPNGEVYSSYELTKIMELAKQKGFFILFDAIFENMYFDKAENYRSKVLQIANQCGALDNVVIVDSLSKTMNFPGERIGYLATTNRGMINTLTDIALARICNPPLTLEPVLQFEGLARKIRGLQKDSPNTSLRTLVGKATEKGAYSRDQNTLIQMYSEWKTWSDEVLWFYRENLEIANSLLEGYLSGSSPDKAAFNTIVRVKGLPDNVNSMDYLAKLMFTLATYTQVGPCFGMSQEVWDRKEGMWSRITYACSRDDLVEGLIRLITFTKFYAELDLGNPNKFPVLDVTYKDQI